ASNTSSSRSLSEPRRRLATKEIAYNANDQTSPTNVNLTTPKATTSSPRSGSTTPTTTRTGDDDARSKMTWMEKQLESLTELVKELTRERASNEQQSPMTPPIARMGIHKGIVKQGSKKKLFNHYNTIE
ncbi:unnamed protein product, partial [Rotaria magnacalcarata]